MNNDYKKDNAFISIQNFLHQPPVIIWGSGATIGYGLPSMADMYKILVEKFPEEFTISSVDKNLEVELGKQLHEKNMLEIKKNYTFSYY